MVTLAVFALAIVLAGAGQTPAAGETALLDFTADWCGPCGSMQSIVKRLEAEGYPVREVNIDRQRGLAERFHVTSIPCFVMVVDGREVDRVVGVTDYDRLVRMLKATRSSPTVPTPARPGSQLAALPPGPADDTASHGADEALVRSTVRICVDDSTGHSYGAGTIIDARDGAALVLTCGHLFREARHDGQILVDLFQAGARKAVPGRLIGYDLKRDLGLLRICPGVPVQAARVAPKGHVISLGDRVANVGCNNGQDPTVRRTHVSAIDRYVGPPNIEAAGTPVEGRSGGGLFDQDGQLIGVCFAADAIDNEGLYAGLASIHAELDRLGLSYVCAPEPARTAADPALLAQAAPLPLAKQMPGTVAPRAAPVAQATPSAGMALVAGQGQPRSDRHNGPAQLTPSERAALSEIRHRSQGAELICIVRPNDPNEKSEIFVLENVSAQFIEQLTESRRKRTAPHLTSMDVPQRTLHDRSTAAGQETTDPFGWQAKRP